MKNKHLLFAIALVLTAGFSAYAQEKIIGEVVLTGETNQEVQFLDPMNPETWVHARRANQFSGDVGLEYLLRAQQQVQDLTRKSSNSLGMAWEELGPNNIGGRTRSFLVDPTNPSICFAGSVGGGLWKSTTGGTSWTKTQTTDGKLFDNQVVSSICRASNGDIYFGTGEGMATVDGIPNNAYFGFPGQGIWKSTDGGNTFEHVASTWTGDAQSAFIWVNAMAADPSNANRIYASTKMGLRMSDNGGQSWVNPMPDMVGLSTDVQVASDGTVIASVANDEDNSMAAYISANGNVDSFTKVSASDGVDVGLLNEMEISRLKFAFAPSDPNYIYCVAAGYTRNNQGVATGWSLENVYQSMDKGQSWKVVGPGGSGAFNFLGSHGNYNNAIAVDPSNPDFILVGGQDMWSWSYNTGWEKITLTEPTELRNRGFYVHINQHAIVWHPTDPNTVFVGTNGGVTVTKNKGETWSIINRNYNVTQFFSVAFSNKGEVVGGSLDNGILYIDYQGNDPMYADWWGGQPPFSTFSSYRHGGEVGISMLDPNMKFYTTPGGVLHRRLIIEDQASVQANYYPYGNGGPWLSPMAIWESFNDPFSWDSVMYIADRDYASGETVVTNSALGARPLKKVLDDALSVGDTVMIHDTYQAMVAIGKDDKAAVKVNRGAVNMRAEFKGDFHSIIPRKSLNIARVWDNDQVIEIEFSKDGNYLYTAIWDVSDQHYKIYRVSNLKNARDRSTMNTDTGFDPETGLPTYVVVTAEIATFDQIPTSINVDPNNPNNVIVTTGNYGNDNFIYMTTSATTAADSSNTFLPIQGNLPQAPVYDAMFNWRSGNEVIVGTEYGVWSTKNIKDASPTWSSENNGGMEILPVFELTQQQFANNAEWGIENHGTIYAATFGRGLWKSESFSTKGATGTGPAIIAETTIDVNIHPNPVSDMAQLSYKLDKAGDVEFLIFDLQGRMVKMVNLHNQTEGDNDYNLEVNDLEAGSYIIRMKANDQKKTTRFMIR